MMPARTSSGQSTAIRSAMTPAGNHPSPKPRNHPNLAIAYAQATKNVIAPTAAEMQP